MPWDTSEDTKHCWVCPQIGQFPVLDVPPSHQVLPPGPLPSPGCAWDFCSVGMLEALLVAPLSPQQCCILLGKKIITTELGEVKKKERFTSSVTTFVSIFPANPWDWPLMAYPEAAIPTWPEGSLSPLSICMGLHGQLSQGVL